MFYCNEKLQFKSAMYILDLISISLLHIYGCVYTFLIFYRRSLLTLRPFDLPHRGSLHNVP